MKLKITFMISVLLLSGCFGSNDRQPNLSKDTILKSGTGGSINYCRPNSVMRIAETIEIRSIDKYLQLSCKGEFCTQETIIGVDNNYSVNIKKNETNNIDDIIQGVFNLKYIAIFTKCTNLCQNVEIYLKQEYPLILSYDIANLGTIKLALSPEINNN